MKKIFVIILNYEYNHMNIDPKKNDVINRKIMDLIAENNK